MAMPEVIKRKGIRNKRQVSRAGTHSDLPRLRRETTEAGVVSFHLERGSAVARSRGASQRARGILLSV
jgi:hypothetical protein